MLKPKEILSAITEQCGRVQIQYGIEKGLGNGGFTFKYISERAKIGEYSLYMQVDGRYVNPVGPFKKKVHCFIELRAEPYDFYTNPYSKGSYRYTCSHSKSFWNKYYTEDAGKLFDELLNELLCHFEEYDESSLTVIDDDNHTYLKKEAYEEDEHFCRRVIKVY